MVKRQARGGYHNLVICLIHLRPHTLPFTVPDGVMVMSRFLVEMRDGVGPGVPSIRFGSFPVNWEIVRFSFLCLGYVCFVTILSRPMGGARSLSQRRGRLMSQRFVHDSV